MSNRRARNPSSAMRLARAVLTEIPSLRRVPPRPSPSPGPVDRADVGHMWPSPGQQELILSTFRTWGASLWLIVERFLCCLGRFGPSFPMVPILSQSLNPNPLRPFCAFRPSTTSDWRVLNPEQGIVTPELKSKLSMKLPRKTSPWCVPSSYLGIPVRCRLGRYFPMIQHAFTFARVCHSSFYTNHPTHCMVSFDSERSIVGGPVLLTWQPGHLPTYLPFLGR
ncbi:hypothetical protein B0J13DRAFT_175945 [Dactylonectria estremocensis]|uniref:Uncharacterized protein n=1 Tax=Dactylonectria estremocensis TaxID=1079267 RepID=A0A9P9J9S9_9HYPO|nr:hypothetical protein B0J13DRAFT_175945 [Dactylonectria estremocensis]